MTCPACGWDQRLGWGIPFKTLAEAKAFSKPYPATFKLISSHKCIARGCGNEFAAVVLR